MSEQTKKMLEELYVLDPSLKDQEPALLAVLDRIDATRPEAPIDQAFLAELRQTLLSAPASANRHPTNIIRNFIETMSKTPFMLGGLAMTAILVAIIVTTPGQAPSQGGDASDQLAFATSIVDAAPGAFGDLSSFGQQTPTGPVTDAPSAAGSAPRSMMTAESVLQPLPPMGGGGKTLATADSKMLIAPWTSQTYTLAMDPENMPFAVTEQPVYRRIVDAKTMTQFVSAVTGRPNGILNLTKLRDLRIERISLFEDRNDGYSMELNLSDGSMTMGLDWRHQQYDPSLDEPLRPSDLPTDETLIAVADEFMDRFAIDRSAYGTPFVEKTWQRYVIMADVQESPIAPSMLSVVYPLLIDDTQVAEYGGEVSGPRVMIRARDLKVMNLYGLSTLRFERSPYELETDPVRITTFAEKGGIRGAIYQPMSYDEQGNPVSPTTDSETLRLGEPEQILMRMFTNVDNVSVELYLPALRFPIKNVPDDQNYYGPQDVIVPLVKSILDETEQTMSQPPVAMPFTTSEEAMIK